LKTRLAASIAFFGGLIVAQIIASAQVMISNLALYQKMSWIAQAGYLTVPGPSILPSLKTVFPAIYGGLFFTLSIGIGISLLSLVCTWLVKHTVSNRIPLTILFSILWLASLIALNWHGLVLIPSSYILLIPVAVSFIYWKLGPERLDRYDYLKLIVHILVIFLLAGVWWTQKNDALFVNIRDQLLLSNKPGISFNDFYYRYTLYPAEAFRGLNQMLLKTYHLSITNSKLDRNRLIRKLERYNYLQIDDNEALTDIKISVDSNRIRLTGNHQKSIEWDVSDFLKHTRKRLTEVSELNDVYLHFRKATSLGLLFGFPLMLYWLLDAFLLAVFSLFLNRNLSSIAGALGCGAIGIGLLLIMPPANQGPIENERLANMLASQDTRTITAALIHIETHKTDLRQFNLTQELIQHPAIAVRYWLARGLSVSADPQDETFLMTLMQDPHPNVACQAIYSLGKRKIKKAIPAMLQIITASDHWYVQLYAYGALRKLGWKQTASN
jgi:hypothetical protein